MQANRRFNSSANNGVNTNFNRGTANGVRAPISTRAQNSQTQPLGLGQNGVNQQVNLQGLGQNLNSQDGLGVYQAVDDQGDLGVFIEAQPQQQQIAEDVCEAPVSQAQYERQINVVSSPIEVISEVRDQCDGSIVQQTQVMNKYIITGEWQLRQNAQVAPEHRGFITQQIRRR